MHEDKISIDCKITGNISWARSLASVFAFSLYRMKTNKYHKI